MATSKPLINLLRGWPNPTLLPTNPIKIAANAALSNPDVSIPGLLYGPDLGYEPLRKEISSWLTRFYKPTKAIDTARICISGGASQCLACILQVYTDPIYTRNVWMVSPTYFLACRIFEDSGFHGKLKSVPEDAEGVDLDFLRKGLMRSEEEATRAGNDKPTLKPPRPWGKIYRHVIYAVPTFSNPSAKVMSLARRQGLVNLAREYDALVITDDVYDQLQWYSRPGDGTASHLETASEPRIVDVDRFLDGGAERPGADGFGNSVSNGSFSKIIGPGSRTGWAEGTTKFAYGLSQVGSSRSGGAPSQLTATIISDFVQSGSLEHHIASILQPAYAKRYKTMMRSIEEHLLPLGVTILQSSDAKVAGGYFIWLSLPSTLAADVVASRCKEEENLIIAQGSLFGVWGDPRDDLKSCVRLCYSWEAEELLEQGIKKLSVVLLRMLEERRSGNRCSSDGVEGGPEVAAHQ